MRRARGFGAQEHGPVSGSGEPTPHPVGNEHCRFVRPPNLMLPISRFWILDTSSLAIGNHQVPKIRTPTKQTFRQFSGVLPGRLTPRQPPRPSQTSLASPPGARRQCKPAHPTVPSSPQESHVPLRPGTRGRHSRPTDAAHPPAGRPGYCRAVLAPPKDLLAGDAAMQEFVNDMDADGDDKGGLKSSAAVTNHPPARPEKRRRSRSNSR